VFCWVQGRRAIQSNKSLKGLSLRAEPDHERERERCQMQSMWPRATRTARSAYGRRAHYKAPTRASRAVINYTLQGARVRFRAPQQSDVRHVRLMLASYSKLKAASDAKSSDGAGKATTRGQAVIGKAAGPRIAHSPSGLHAWCTAQLFSPRAGSAAIGQRSRSHADLAPRRIMMITYAVGQLAHSLPGVCEIAWIGYLLRATTCVLALHYTGRERKEGERETKR
jgi:hypothetical protein